MGIDMAAVVSWDALGLSPRADAVADADASSGKKVLKTPLCCQAWMKNSCCVGSLMALTSLLPSGCLR